MRPGYKQTEVGVIPEDWDVKRLGDILDTDPENLSSDTKAGFAFNYIALEDIDCGVLLSYSEQRFATAPSRARRKLCQDDVLVSTVRPNLLSHLLFRAEGGNWVCSTGFCVARCRQDVSHPGYIFFHLFADGANRQIEALLTGSNYPAINSSDVRALQIPFPTYDEQSAIAAALSDVNALLDGLDRLIAKKRHLKQAVMQQLLTGQTRLPGFRGKWQPLNLAQNSLLKARIGWQGLTTAEYLATGTYHLVTGTDFTAGKVNWATCPFVAADRYEQDRNIQLRPNDVLVTKDGTIGKVALVDKLPGPATLNSGVFVIRPKGNAYEPRFLYQILASAVFADFLRRLAAGSTISHLYQKDFVSFVFPAPPTVQEQGAIADAIADMDAEIAALEARRNKTRDLKQAMMQELLTGRTRLVPSEAVHA